MHFTDNALARILTENYADRSEKLTPSYGLCYCVYPKPVNDDCVAESSARQFPLEKLHRERIGR